MKGLSKLSRKCVMTSLCSPALSSILKIIKIIIGKLIKIMRVELVQGHETLFEREKNARFIESRAEESSADLIIFPELFLTGYEIGERAFELAERRDSELVARIAESARENKKALIFGAVEEDEETRGIYYNSAFVIDEEGRIDTYR
jgi:predicted amidohydrolase